MRIVVVSGGGMGDGDGAAVAEGASTAAGAGGEHVADCDGGDDTESAQDQLAASDHHCPPLGALATMQGWQYTPAVMTVSSCRSGQPYFWAVSSRIFTCRPSRTSRKAASLTTCVDAKPCINSCLKNSLEAGQFSHRAPHQRSPSARSPRLPRVGWASGLSGDGGEDVL